MTWVYIEGSIILMPPTYAGEYAEKYPNNIVFEAELVMED